MPMKSQRGIALITVLMAVAVAASLGALLFSRSLSEIRHSGDNAGIIQTLLLARGSANLGGLLLDDAGPVKGLLTAIIQNPASPAAANLTGRWSYGSGTGDRPDPTSVISGLNAVANALQTEVDRLICGQTIRPPGAQGQATLRVFFTGTACGIPLPAGLRLPVGRFVEGQPRTAIGPAAGQTYALPFIMVAEGSRPPHRRNIVAQGEYRFEVGSTSFARYALFTNVHTTETGSEIWFTERTLFDGPVHTNNFFRFFRAPWFGGEVTSAGCTSPGASACLGGVDPGGEFYGVGFRGPRAMSPTSLAPSFTNRWGTHAPHLTGGVDWGAAFVPMPRNALDQQAAARASGIAITGNLFSLNLAATDAAGNPLNWDARAGAWAPPAVFQYLTACTGASPGTCTVYRFGPDQRLFRQTPAGWVLDRDRFNGVIHVGGRVDRLLGPARVQPTNPATAPPAIASFAQLTLAAQGDLRITSDLKYESPPCTGSPRRNPDGTVTSAVCDNLGAQNVLGVYSAAGDVLIGHGNSAGLNAPADVTVHGVLMSGTGVIAVENFRSGSPRGDVHLLGGVIQYYYGGFGTFDASTGANRTGFGRRFTYDQRMRHGLAPPLFPTTGRDEVRKVLLFVFGQREQMF